MKCQLEKLMLPGLLVYLLIFSNSQNSFGQLPQKNSIDLYSIAIASIASEIIKEDTLNLKDSLYFTLPSNIKCNPPGKINDVAIIYLDIEALSLPNGGYLVCNVYPLYTENEVLILNYFIEYLILNEMEQSWVCCQGCSSGGDIVFNFNCESKLYELKAISYYNCFEE